MYRQGGMMGKMTLKELADLRRQGAKITWAPKSQPEPEAIQLEEEVIEDMPMEEHEPVVEIPKKSRKVMVTFSRGKNGLLEGMTMEEV
jgi:hypothetical protein